MIKRDTWRDAESAKAWIARLSGVVSYAAARFNGKQDAVCPSEFSWLVLFDNQGVREFVTELNDAILRATQKMATWHTVKTVVDEWTNTAALLEKEEVADRLAQFKKREPL
jgi:hypothetical protein